MYDLAVLGGGPGGYVAAIRGVQEGLKTVLLEKDTLGGTCLNKGCIPTKCLIHDVAIYDRAKKSEFLDGRERLQINLPRIVERKRQVVNRLVSGVRGLLHKKQVEVLSGTGKLIEPGKILFDGGMESGVLLSASKIILATGSEPAVPRFIDVDGEFVQTTDNVLDATTIPQHVVIIGGGVIGLEMAGLYRGMGTRVTIIEMLPEILMSEDKDIRKIMIREIKKANIALWLEASVQEIRTDDRFVIFTDKTGQVQTISCDLVVVATGRKPVTTGIETSELGLATESSYISVNEFQQSNLPNVYAIGDVVGGLMLAHKASTEANIAVGHIMGQKKHMDYRKIPRCIWGITEVGAAGMSEDEAIESGYSVNTGVFPLSASGAAQAMNNPEGMVKVIADGETGEILGVHIIGAHATELIAEAVTVMTMEGSVEDLYESVKPHPTVSESIMEAALDWNNLAIHK
jgi:dihydrolipoamide dehydrogenase